MEHPHGGGQIALDTRFCSRNWIQAGIAPLVVLDGQPVAARWGQQAIPVPAGQHRIDIHARMRRDYGAASLVLQVAPGQSVPVFYAAPMIEFFAAGSIGHEPQKTPGLGLLIALVLGFVLLLVFCCALPLVFFFL